jgi:hypothetical protein
LDKDTNGDMLKLEKGKLIVPAGAEQPKNKPESK